MARPNNKKKQQANDYFTQNIKKFGENFLASKTAKNIEFDAPRIFRDMARGILDVAKYGHYFYDSQFMNSLITTAQVQYSLNYTAADALSFKINYCGCNNIQINNEYISAQNFYKMKADAYLIIINGLVTVVNTGDINYLYVIANQLIPYKYSI